MKINNIKRRILSFGLALGIFIGVAVTPAHAEWEKNSNGWNYYENGTLKTGWLLDNGQWYYLNSKGNMITGWVIDKGTWYYMREDGSLNNSKTTSVMPSEIQSTINIIKPFANGLNIQYAGIGYVKETDGFSNYGLANKRVIIFKAEDEYGNSTDFYYVYDPYNCKVYKLFDNLTIKYLGQGTETNFINQDQAKINVKNYLTDNNKNIPGIIGIESNNDESNVFSAHCYNDMGDHTATTGWYYIDKSTGYIIQML